MSLSISCRELGLDCVFECEGETEESVVDLVIRHVQTEHDGEWYEIEEIYQAARSVVRGKAA